MQVDMNFEWNKYLRIVKESEQHMQRNAHLQQQQELRTILSKHIYEFNKSILETAKKNCSNIISQRIIDKAIEENINSLNTCNLAEKVYTSFIKIVGIKNLENPISNYNKMINQICHDFNPSSIKPNISHEDFDIFLSSSILSNIYSYPNDSKLSTNLTKIEFIGNARLAANQFAEIISVCIEACRNNKISHEFISKEGWAEVGLPQEFEMLPIVEEENAPIAGDNLSETDTNTI